MILRLVHPGSPPRGPLDDVARDYQARLGRHHRVEELWLKPSKRSDTALALAEEAERISSAVKDRDLLVLLDRTGRMMSSEQLSVRFETWLGSSHQSVVFALGSACGLASSLRRLPRVESISFGMITLPHDLARVILWEQLYRASSILRGEPYHK